MDKDKMQNMRTDGLKDGGNVKSLALSPTHTNLVEDIKELT